MNPLRRLRRAWPFAASIAVLAAAAWGAATPTAPDPHDGPAYPVEAVNAGFPGLPPADARSTPHATLAFFQREAAAERWAIAAHALDLRAVAPEARAERAPELARKFAYLLGKAIDLDWEAIPDRPDGARDAPVGADVEDALDPVARRTLLLGRASLGERVAELRLDRVRPVDGEAVWLVSARTVAEIDALYDVHGPGRIERSVPDWMRLEIRGSPVWQWAELLVATLLAAALALAVRWGLRRGAGGAWLQRLARSVATPLALLVGSVALWSVHAFLLVLAGNVARTTATALEVAITLSLTWLGVAIVRFVADQLGRAHLDEVAAGDVAKARKRGTGMWVARRGLMVLAVLVGGGIALSQFEAMRSLGTSLLASAGVATLVVVVAAQSSLGNLVAGVQIALTQPFRIGDVVFFEETVSYVEDVTYTFVVLRTWDERRFVVPNTYIVSTPQENWDVTSASMVMSVAIFVDPATPIEAVRRRYHELIESRDDWHESTTPRLVVNKLREGSVELLALCSASDADQTWEQSVWLREALLAFLRDEAGGRYLARQRVAVDTLNPSEASHGGDADASTSGDA